MANGIEVSIKNSKYVPGWLQGFSTLVFAIDEKGNEFCIARIFYRATKTRRRVFSGENRWDLFAVEILRGDYRVTSQVRVADGEVVLGRRDGENIAVAFGKVLAGAEKLPNGFTLPEEVRWGEEVTFRPEWPNRELVERGLGLLPFHQPGGEGSRPEVVDQEEFLINEQISWLAQNFPSKWRTVSDRPIQEQLRELFEVSRVCDFAQFGYCSEDGAALETMLKYLGIDTVAKNGDEHEFDGFLLSVFEFDTGFVTVQIQGKGVEKLALPMTGSEGLALGVISAATDLQWNWHANCIDMPVRFMGRFAKDGVPTAL